MELLTESCLLNGNWYNLCTDSKPMGVGNMSARQKEYMSYEEYLAKIKDGIVTENGHCPVTSLLVMLQGRRKSQLMNDIDG